MKNLIILILILAAGFFVIYNRGQSPEDLDPYESEEYTETTETEEEGRDIPPCPSPLPPLLLSQKTQQVKTSPPLPHRRALPKRWWRRPKKKSVPKIWSMPSRISPRKNCRRSSNTTGSSKASGKMWLGICSEKIFPEYQKMRREFQRERQESFQKFHFSMVEQHGADHVYSPTEYEDQIGRAIQEKYFKKIEDRFGPKRTIAI